MRDETVRASPDGGQGYVWLLPRSQVEEEHLSCLFVFIDILFGNRAITQRNLDYFLDHQQMFEVIKFNLHWEGNIATVSFICPDQMQIVFDSTLAQVFIDTDEPIFPTEGIYSSGDYKTLMNLVRAANNITI